MWHIGDKVFEIQRKMHLFYAFSVSEVLGVAGRGIKLTS